MQATITYLLTEQAQRAQMAATGQPVARKQIITVEVPAEDIGLMQVNEDGTLYLDLTSVDVPPPHQDALKAMGQHYDYLNSKVNRVAGYLITDAKADVLALIKAGYAKLKADAEESAKRKAAALVKNLTDQLAAVDRFLSDPALRLNIGSGMNYAYIGGERVDEDANEYHAALPRETWHAILAENHRRKALDRAAKEAADAETARLREEKEAAAAAKEQAKLDYLKSWIAEHGTPSQIARSAENLLPREEAITALADATFAPLATTRETLVGNKPVFPRYTNASRPEPECSNEECEAEDCKVTHSVTDSVDSLCEEQYAIYTAIRAAMPDATYADGGELVVGELVPRTHSAAHDCDHSPDCHKGVNYGCMVKMAVGPFSLQREYEL